MVLTIGSDYAYFSESLRDDLINHYYGFEG